MSSGHFSEPTLDKSIDKEGLSNELKPNLSVLQPPPLEREGLMLKISNGAKSVFCNETVPVGIGSLAKLVTASGGPLSWMVGLTAQILTDKLQDAACHENLESVKKR